MRLHHCGFSVENIEQTAKLFEDLGFEVSPIEEFSGERIQTLLGKPSIRLARVKMDGGNVEFVQSTFPHICVEVEDLMGLYDTLKMKGIKTLSPPVWSKYGYLNGAFFAEIGGVNMEFVRNPT